MSHDGPSHQHASRHSHGCKMSRPGMDPPARILLTKIGLDGHDRGSRVVAAFLRDAGMEVLYTPPWQEIRQVVRLAEEEDVDAIGISSLATDHLLVPKLMNALAKAHLGHVPVVVGGIVPDADAIRLRKAGVRHVFHPGASREEIVDVMARLAAQARAAKAKDVNA
jgi:methylmalonyl-CoA mutase, C-terminal domain